MCENKNEDGLQDKMRRGVSMLRFILARLSLTYYCVSHMTQQQYTFVDIWF